MATQLRIYLFVTYDSYPTYVIPADAGIQHRFKQIIEIATPLKNNQ
jgi:hypothetical protein